MKAFTPEEIKYITENENKDPATLILQAARYPDLPVGQLVQHIQARQKAKHKLPTWYRHPAVRYPALLSVEQSSSEITAAFKASLFTGNTLVDLTGGFGVDAFYFAKSFKEVFYIEQNTTLAELAAYNARILKAANIKFYSNDAAAFLHLFNQTADCIYLDPARRDNANRKVHLLQDCEPDVLALLPLLQKKAQNILLKTSPMLDINQAIGQLPTVQKIYAVAVENECKEVLYHFTSMANINPLVVAVNLMPGKKDQYFTFDYVAEENALVKYGEPLTYIYEPNAAIMKAGGFKILAQTYALYKLHRNSHLYTSEEVIKDFPGRIFRLKAVCRYQKKELLAFLPEKKANITVRNFPDTVAQIRAKTGIKEGGNIYLLATTDINQRLMLLVCEKAEQ